MQNKNTFVQLLIETPTHFKKSVPQKSTCITATKLDKFKQGCRGIYRSAQHRLFPVEFYRNRSVCI